MANNYCQSSSFIKIDPEKIESAKEIVERLLETYEDSDEGVGIEVAVESAGVFLRGDESFNAEQAEEVVRALVDVLNLEGVHVCSWAYTCDKPRVGEFGGGAFAVVRGHDTIFIDAASEVYDKAIKLLGGQ